MNVREKNIRQAATRLSEAIAEGREAGLRVEWPADAKGLASIAISETGKADQAEAAAPKTT